MLPRRINTLHDTLRFQRPRSRIVKRIPEIPAHLLHHKHFLFTEQSLRDFRPYMEEETIYDIYANLSDDEKAKIRVDYKISLWLAIAISHPEMLPKTLHDLALKMIIPQRVIFQAVLIWGDKLQCRYWMELYKENGELTPLLDMTITYGNKQAILHLDSMIAPEELLSKIRNNASKLYLSAAEHNTVYALRYLERKVPDDEKLAMFGSLNNLLKAVIDKQKWTALDHLLSNISIFMYAQQNSPTYNKWLDWQITRKIETMQNPDLGFGQTELHTYPQDPQYLYLMAGYMIKTLNNPTNSILQSDLLFLLELPSFRKIANANNNLLLALAKYHKNTQAVGILLNIPAVKALAHSMNQASQLSLAQESSLPVLSAFSHLFIRSSSKEFQAFHEGLETKHEYFFDDSDEGDEADLTNEENEGDEGDETLLNLSDQRIPTQTNLPPVLSTLPYRFIGNNPKAQNKELQELCNALDEALVIEDSCEIVSPAGL